MRKRLVIVIVAAATFVLAGAAFATGGGKGLIWDDGHFAQPGTLDDGKELLPQTRITLAEANAAAQHAARGDLGQVDLEQVGDRVVYTVDVGDQEVRVDATDGTIASVAPRD